MLKFSLKTKLVLFIALLMIILLITGSFILIYQERELIITRHLEIGKAIIKSYAPSITDAMMYKEMGILPVEGSIDEYADQIKKQRVFPVKFIRIVSENFEEIAKRSPLGLEEILSDFLLYNNISKNLSQSILHHPEYGWVLGSVESLEISGRKWGYLIVGFDADIIREEINMLFINLITIATLVIILTLISVYFITGHLTKNLNKIVSAMDLIDINTEEIITVPQSDDEIGFLAKRFNEMQSRLHRSRNELKNAQKEIYHAEKLASIGRLASGVAHEINNPLMGLKNCAQSISTEPTNIDQTKNYIELMTEGLEKIESIVRKLLDFAHKKSHDMQEIYINKSLERVLQLVEYRLEKYDIKLVSDFSADLHPVFADPQLVEEVFMNILINSVDALPSGGKILLSTNNIDNRKVEVKIIDDGIGISDDHLDKIFDPFFTTKGIGKGTGLGLSVSSTIIKELGGKILVESEIDKGTSFKIIIPVRNSTNPQENIDDNHKIKLDK
jgi:two-component system, NtrC family, sensor kinase